MKILSDLLSSISKFIVPPCPSVRKEKYLGPDVLQGKGIKVKQYMIKAPLGKRKVTLK